MEHTIQTQSHSDGVWETNSCVISKLHYFTTKKQTNKQKVLLSNSLLLVLRQILHPNKVVSVFKM